MELIMYTVWDSKADAYIQPFFSVNNAVAIRSFQSACQDQAHDFHRHAADYTLFRLAKFNQATGDLQPENMVMMAHAHELKKDNN